MITLMVILAFLAIGVGMYAMWRDSRTPEPEPVRPDWLYGDDGQAPGKTSTHMAVPRKYPALRTRRSKVYTS